MRHTERDREREKDWLASNDGVKGAGHHTAPFDKRFLPTGDGDGSLANTGQSSSAVTRIADHFTNTRQYHSLGKFEILILP